MKIGILTFHSAHNYGAMLQCFGLQEYLKSIGHDVFVIDYRPSYFESYYKKHSIRQWISRNPLICLKNVLTEPFLWKTRSIRHNSFEYFAHHRLNLYPYSPGMNYSEFDAIIVGSDQIWEAPITGGEYDDVYFAKNAKCRKISYAASSKIKVLSSDDVTFFRSRLLSFHAIGVREKQLQSLLSDALGRSISLNIDPTLLAGDIMIKQLIHESTRENPYVLVYEVVEHTEVLLAAKNYAERIKADIVVLSAAVHSDYLRIRDQVASPEQFVNYFKNASCVFTTSFHGTAFSILCKVPFYSFKQHNTSDLRIESLLSILGLSDRFVDMNSTICDNCVDFKRVDYSLEKARKVSEVFLLEALK